MEWVKLSTSYYLDGAILQAGEAAEVLFMRCLAYSGAQETRGRIPRSVLPLLAPTGRQSRVKALLAAGLLVEDGEDLLIRSWERHQEALDSESERRRKAREKKARQRETARLTAESVPGTPGGQSPGRPRHIEVEVEEDENISSGEAGEEARSDVDGLCRYFLAAISRNGSKGTITKRWLTDARLLLDKDEREPREIRAVIDWATTDAFWAPNVLSVPKLREKYDQLRLGMQRSRPTDDGDPHKAWLREQG